MTSFDRTLAAVRRSIDDGLNLGFQLCVVLDAHPLLDTAVGQARAGVPMRTDTLITWWSMTKPTTAVAVGQLWERGLLEIDDPVVAHVPEFGQGGKEAVTLRHLLTHTGGFRSADQARGRSWDEIVAAICAVPLEPRWVPGKKAGYHLTAGMTMLGEVVRRVDGRPFETYVREEIFGPLSMPDCWVGMPPDRHRAYGELIGTMHDTTGDEPVPLTDLDSEKVMARCSPGGGGRGPMNQLVRMYRMLLGRGTLDGARVLSPQTAEALTARHRVGMYDKTFGGVVDWGLGVQVDSYSMGAHCSPRTFGHGGARSSTAFADPEVGLAVTMLCNGMPEVGAHQQRMHAISTAIYADLGLAEGDGREKVAAKYA